MGSMSPENYRYEKRFGTYYLMDGDNILHAGDVIAIAFTMDPDGMVTMHKHGEADLVRQWVDKSRLEWQQSGLADIAGDLAMIESDKWDVEDLNKIIHNTGWITAFLKRENIDVAELTAACRGQQLDSSSDNFNPHDGD